MIFTIENEVLTIVLAGRLDSDSVAAAEQEIDDIRKANLHTSLLIDAADLTYIASSGLRMILKLAKSEASFKIENVSENVYNVFAMTGFSKIINMTKALRKIDLEKCEKIGSGGHGAIYRVSEDEIVKVNFNPETFQNLEAELNIAKEAFLLGVPTAISFDIVDCGDGRRGIVYEIMKSKTLGEVIQSNPERMEEYADEYIRQLNNLHSIHTDNPIFGRAKDQYYKQLEGASKYLTEEEVMLLKKVVDALPDGDRLVHSDAHPKNIMIQNGEMMWIDMELMSIGHPIYDIISISVMIMGMPTEEMAIRLSGMSLENLARLKSYFIRKYFKTEDPEMIARLEAVMNSLRLIRTVFSIGIDTVNVKDHRQGIVNLAREVFFPNVDRIIGGIRMMISMIS